MRNSWQNMEPCVLDSVQCMSSSKPWIIVPSRDHNRIK